MRLGTDAAQSLDAGAAEEVEEEGLDVVVAVVGGGHAGVAVLAAEAAEEVVAQGARSLLDAHLVRGGVGVGVVAFGMEHGSIALGQAAHECLVAVAVAGAQVEVAVRDGEGDACAVAEVGQGY